MSDSMIAPYTKHKLMTVGRLSPRPRSIWCQAAGTFNAKDEDGTDLAYTMTAGTVLPFRAVECVSITSGTFYICS